MEMKVHSKIGNAGLLFSQKINPARLILKKKITLNEINFDFSP